jgi:hypothetical protein
MSIAAFNDAYDRANNGYNPPAAPAFLARTGHSVNRRPFGM